MLDAVEANGPMVEAALPTHSPPHLSLFREQLELEDEYIYIYWIVCK